MKSIQMLIIISGLSLSNGIAVAGRVAGFGGSTEITQILNDVVRVNQPALIYQQIQETLQQVLDNAKAVGATGIGGIAAGAGRALGSAGIEATSDTIKGIGSSSAGGGGRAGRIGANKARLNKTNAAGAISAASIPGSQPTPSPDVPQTASAPAMLGQGGPAALPLLADVLRRTNRGKRTRRREH